MYIAIATLSNRWVGNDLEKMISYVDKKNTEPTHNKYFLVELNDWDYNIYKRNKNFYACHPTIVYDPYNIGESYLKAQSMYSNGFARTFGSRSRDH